jgi:hypothetical protein
MNSMERNQQHRIPYHNVVDADGHVFGAAGYLGEIHRPAVSR